MQRRPVTMLCSATKGNTTETWAVNERQLAGAAGFVVRCLPIYETPEQFKNLLLNPQLEQKGQ